VKQPLLLLLLILLVEGFYWDQSSSMILLHSRQGKASKQASKQLVNFHAQWQLLD
jgi:hypothetical protein